MLVCVHVCVCVFVPVNICICVCFYVFIKKQGAEGQRNGVIGRAVRLQRRTEGKVMSEVKLVYSYF